MFYKYLFSQNIIGLVQSTNIISFSYTALTDEPSLMHSHPYTEIIVPQNNFGKLLYNETETACKTGNLYLISPNVSHTEKGLYNTKKAEDYYCFKYFSVKLNCVIYPSEEKDSLITIKKREVADELNGYLLNAYKSVSLYKSEELCALNLSCFYNLLILHITKSGYKINTGSPKRYSSITQELEYYISQNYTTEVNIADFAKKNGVHHNTLTKKFKEETGTTPKNYLLQTRINTSKHLLTSTDFSISQIASMCSFASHAYFSMIFKKNCGLTPQEYREKHFTAK